jgi:hypothetical protein
VRDRPQIQAAAARASMTFRTVPVTITGAAAPTIDQPAKFRMVANTGEPMRIWPWEDPVVVDLDTVDLSAQAIPALYDHCPDADYIVGQVEAVAIEAGQLVATGRFVLTDAPAERNWAKKVLDRARAGYQWQTSIGGDPASVEKIAAGQSVVVNGRTYAGPVNVARGVTLREISFVVLGGDRRTSAVVSRQGVRLKGKAMPTFEDWVASLGFDVASLTDQQRAAMQIQYDEKYGTTAGDVPTNAEDATPPEEEVAAEGTMIPEEEEVVPPPSNARTKPSKLTAAAAVAAERSRIREITRLCTEHGNPKVKAGDRRVPLMAHALAAGWSANQVKTELLKSKRAERPSGPAIISKSHDKDCSLQAMQGAFLLRAGAKLDHPAYQTPRAMFLQLPQWLRAGINDAGRNRIMEAAHKYADMSAVDLCREACRLDGKNPGHGRNATIQAAFSGSSLGNIFTTNVNAILLSSYLEAPDSTIGWCQEQDVADFKTQERPRVDVITGLERLPRGGEADHAQYNDSSESYKVSRYAKQFVVDEQDIIDDSLGALSDTPNRFGSAAARLRPDLVYSVLLANPTLSATSRALFNATDGNLGTSSALAAATLRTAIAAMNNVRENSVNLNLTPSHLIVPPSLRFLAKELIASASIVIAGTAGSVTERGSMNSLADEGLTMVSDSRLENGLTDPSSKTAYAGSTSTWYLASTMAHTIEVGYLRGSGRAPRVRSGQLDKGQFGMWWDVSMDIGVKALDWKGLRRTTA